MDMEEGYMTACRQGGKRKGGKGWEEEGKAPGGRAGITIAPPLLPSPSLPKGKETHFSRRDKEGKAPPPLESLEETGVHVHFHRDLSTLGGWQGGHSLATGGHYPTHILPPQKKLEAVFAG